MFEVLVLFLLGGLTILAAFFLRHSVQRKTTQCHTEEKQYPPPPGWESAPADSEFGDLQVAQSCGSLQEYLLQKHDGGRRDVLSFWWHNRRVVSVCTPETFVATENLFNRPKLIFAQCFEPLHGSNSIQSINGREWQERKKLLHGTIRGRNLESFFDDFVRIAQETEKAWFPDKPLRLMKEMFRMTLKAVLSTCLGNVFQDDSSVDWLANTYHVCKREMDGRILKAPAPDSVQEKTFQENLKSLKECLRKMMKVYKEQKNLKKLPLMEALTESGAPEEQILSDMITFSGGFHTLGYYATWTLTYLAQHPNVQDKLYREISSRVMGDYGEKLKAYTLTSKSYLRQFLDEALRMSTTVAFSGHYSDQDLAVGGYSVPAGTPIIHAIGVAMKSESVWDEVNSFNPERFAPETKHAKRGPEFRPFGVPHARRCPANQFAYFMVSVYVTILLQRFIFLPVKNEIPGKKYGIATSPTDDVYIQVEFRKN